MEKISDEDGNEYLIFESPDDGNCFYHSLASWYRLHGYDPAEMNQVALRAAVVKQKLVAANTNYADGAINMNTYPTLNSYKANIMNKMGRNGQWAHPLNDTVVDAAAVALGINIHVINVDEDYEYTTANPAGAALIHMHRINRNHFNLLIPVEDLTPVMEAEMAAIEAEKRKPRPSAKKASAKTRKASAAAAKSNSNSGSGSGSNGLILAMKKIRIKKPSATRKVSVKIPKKGPYLPLYKKGFTPDNIKRLQKEYDMKQENILSSDVWFLRNILGKSSLNSSNLESSN